MVTIGEMTPCVVCQTHSTTRCSRCKVAYYCSAKCQKEDWRTHKVACTPTGQPEATTSSSSSTTTPSVPKLPKLPDPTQPVNLHPTTPSKPTDYRKPAPKASCTDLKFHFENSSDGVDENLVIFFHGLGDKIEPSFVELARSIRLPQTATCCIQAPTPVPYIEEEGWQWYPSFNLLNGELLGPECPERMLQVKQVVRPNLIKFIQHCIDYCGFSSRNIILFGFSQGGQIALDLAAFGGFNLRAVLSIAGYCMEEVQNDAAATKPLNTEVLVVQGTADDVISVKDAKDKIKYLQRVFGRSNVQHRIVEGGSLGIPDSE
ncbi:hypothetical protein BGW38_010185, partial [Lunasporangiospora selenospora]